MEKSQEPHWLSGNGGSHHGAPDLTWGGSIDSAAQATISRGEGMVGTCLNHALWLSVIRCLWSCDHKRTLPWHPEEQMNDHIRVPKTGFVHTLKVCESYF